MVKGVFFRLMGRPADAIPYGTQDEEQSLHVVTPVKYTQHRQQQTVLEHSVVTTRTEVAEPALVVAGDAANNNGSIGFVQVLFLTLKTH